MVEKSRQEWTPKASLEPTKYRPPCLWERIKMDHVTAEILGVDTGKPPYSDDKQQMEWESEVFRTIEAMIGK